MKIIIDTASSFFMYVGPEANLLEATEAHAHRLRIQHLILTNEELTSLKHLDYRGWSSKTIDITYPAGSGRKGLLAELDRICAEASAAIDEGRSLVILSDRAICAERVALFNAISAGEQEFRAIAIASDGSGFTQPCGACRQVIMDLAGDIDVILSNGRGGVKIQRMGELLPHPFGAGNLKRG